MKGTESKKVVFHIKNPLKEGKFLPLKFEMLSLKDGCSSDLKQKHYLNNLDGLMDALNTILDKSNDMKASQEEDEYDAVDPKGYQYRTKINWQDDMEKPLSQEKIFDQWTSDQKYQRIEKEAHLEIHKKAHKMVLKNLYKTYYDLPNDFMARKADSTMEAIVESSEALRKARVLQERGMHPSLIFFSKELYDNQISRCMQILHGSHLKGDQKTDTHFQKVREINDILLGSDPSLGIMFAKVKNIDCEKVPGYISVPALSFSVTDLVEYLRDAKNLLKARTFASKYILGHKMFEKAH